MAFTLFLRKTCNGSVITNVASKLLTKQAVNSSFVGSTIGAKYFNTLYRPINEEKKLLMNVDQRVVLQNKYVHHGHIWAMEKYVSWALLGIIPAGLAFPSPMMDNLMAIAMVIHMHWGIEAIVVDYVRPVIFGEVLPKIARLLVYLLSAFTLGGLMYFNMNDIGLGKATRQFWAVKN